MNDIANLCELVGADVNMVRKGIGSDARIGSKFLYPGCGYGGSCFPKDVKALIKTAKKEGYSMSVLKAVEEVNENQKNILFNKLNKHYEGKLQGKRIAIWGLAFKAETDDMENSGYKTMIEWYNEKLKGTNIKLAIYDLRELRSKFVNSVLVYTTERYEYTGKGGVIVDLNADSEFFGMNARNYENIRITYYDPAILKKYHNAEVNEYKIAKEILEADVIINMPKPKVHRMAGTTVSLKNLVGINSRKEYLPHHINGSPDEGGDQYMYDSLWKIINNKLTDVRNYQMQTNKNISLGWILTQLVRITSRLARWFSKDHYNNGMTKGMFVTDRIYLDDSFEKRYSLQRYRNWTRTEFFRGTQLYNIIYGGVDVGFLLFKLFDARMNVLLWGLYEQFQHHGLVSLILISISYPLVQNNIIGIRNSVIQLIVYGIIVVSIFLVAVLLFFRCDLNYIIKKK